MASDMSGMEEEREMDSDMSGMGDDVGVGTGKGGLKWESGRGRLKQK
jgi:hypothetical protein